MKRFILQHTASLLALSVSTLIAGAVTLPALDDASSGTVVLAATKSKPGSCGTNMYWSAKSGKCMDARSKSKSNWMPW
jgi:uncharacterized low-complexity protein